MSETVEPLTGQLQRALGIPNGFLDGLGDDEDWAFVIKIHALMESSVNHQIIAALKEDRLKKFVARLDTSNSASGKLAIVKALDLLPPKLQKFMTGFSTLRNTFVHDAKHLAYSINECLRSMEGSKGKDCRAGLRAHLAESVTMTTAEGVKEFTPDEFLTEHPRIVI